MQPFFHSPKNCEQNEPENSHASLNVAIVKAANRRFNRNFGTRLTLDEYINSLSDFNKWLELVLFLRKCGRVNFKISMKDPDAQAKIQHEFGLARFLCRDCIAKAYKRMGPELSDKITAAVTEYERICSAGLTN